MEKIKFQLEKVNEKKKLFFSKPKFLQFKLIAKWFFVVLFGSLSVYGDFKLVKDFLSNNMNEFWGIGLLTCSFITLLTLGIAALRVK